MNQTIIKKILQKKAIGIDIDDRSIEVIELVKGESNNIKISSLGRVVLDSQIIKRGRIKDSKRLARALRRLLDNATPHPILKTGKSILGSLFAPKVIFGLPESQVYVHIFDLKIEQLKDEKIDYLVSKEACNTIPIDEKDLIYSYRILNKGKEKTKILLIATSRDVMSEWQIFFKLFHIKMEYFDVEVMASFRGLLIEDKDKKLPICIVDIGAVTTSVSIFDKNGLVYSHSIDVAGEDLTKEIAKNLKIDIKQAEADKVMYGLDISKKIFPILIKVLEPVLAEIKLNLNFFEKEHNKKIENIILIGGSSKLKGIKDYFKTNLNKEVNIGNSVLVNRDTEDHRDEAPLEYIESVGLALAGFDRKYIKGGTFLYLQAPKESIKDIRQGIQNSLKEKTTNQVAKFSAFEGRFVFLRNIIHMDRSKFLKKILYMFIFIGLVLLGLAFWYREAQRELRRENIKSKVSQLAEMQGLKVEVPVSIVESEHRDDRAKGRIIINKIEVAQTYNEAIEESRAEALEALTAGEVIWDDPIEKSDADNVIFPLEIKWLAYNEQEVNQLIVGEIEKLNKEEIDYIVNNIKKNRVYKKSDNSNIFYIEARIIISSHKPIEMINDFKEEVGLEGDALEELINGQEDSEEKQADSVLKEDVEVEKEAVESEVWEDEYSNFPTATIKETEFGWLNVRTGPGSNYNILTKVYPGESYPLLETSGKWYKIKMDVDRVGWVHSVYIIKKI